jgi:hypothetical protein
MADIALCVVFMLCILLPMHVLVMREFERWDSPEYFRRHGVIIRRPEALEAAAEAIGSYRGAGIPASVTFKGMRYEFAGVVPPRYQAAIRENELYLDPGLLYVTGLR